ncbi:MAG: glycosyltransferase [Marinobacter sp.]|uniref:glycosyltransferase n=1 Tax=Marinobacter sp. TaxID=50741 RepID=UPI0034A0AD38
MKSPIKNFIVFRLMKAVLMVNSDSLKGDMLKYPKLFGHHNVIRVYNGFERPSVEGESLDLRTRFDLPPETVLVGCAGRFSPQKGFDLLPDILSALPNHVHVVHAGDGEYEDTIKAAINARSESKRIHFVGYQSNMQAFFRSIDLFLLCSRNEGMANVLNEAMSFGIPVVSTRVPGSEELLAHGKYGVLTDVNDVQAMAEGIRSIVIGERVFQSADLRQWIDQEFGFQKMILETNRLFFETELK